MVSYEQVLSDTYIENSLVNGLKNCTVEHVKRSMYCGDISGLIYLLCNTGEVTGTLSVGYLSLDKGNCHHFSSLF